MKLNVAGTRVFQDAVSSAHHNCMRLVSFAVQNYRSITKTSKLLLQPTATVLIGPNNEGKSNLVAAIAVAMTAIRAMGSGKSAHATGAFPWRRSDLMRYRWRHDFPIGLQATSPKGESHFDLDFLLTDSEIEEFWNEVGSTLNGVLPIRISFGNHSFKFRVRKKGPGANSLSKKADAIASFLGKRVDFRHIRAVRRAEEAQRVVQALVRQELAVLNRDPDFQAAVQQIAVLQAPILKALSDNVRNTLKAFLPSVSSVDIRVPQEDRYSALTEYTEIVVDDGVPTRLEFKGDGVQSLAALSLMRFASQTGAGTRELILAIEEPESHLHPRAIQQLRVVLTEIAQQHQTILTTHCPLFVERNKPGANIIVVDSEARQAKTTADIREVLGARVSDNLMHAELVLIVEGETDSTILGAWLTAFSKSIAQSIASNYLVIDQLVGSGKLPHRLLAARDAMCSAYCFLDDDDAGRSAVKLAQKDGLLKPSEYMLAKRPGLRQSEIEDLIDTKLYAGYVEEAYGVNLQKKPFTTSNQKWSERLEAAFAAAGKLCDESICRDIKNHICGQVLLDPSAAVPDPFMPLLKQLASSLEARIG
jgi:putative ATP-dependent endonuclease of OLD family